MRPVTCVVEGWSDDPVARRMLEAVGLTPGVVIVEGGKPKLDPKLPDYNRTARHMPWLIVRDLDHDDRRDCIPDLRLRLLGGAPSVGMCFRLAVREIEAWLMADHRNCAAFFAVGLGAIPSNLEGLQDPKQALVNLCRHSRKRDIREGMVPRPRSGRAVGPRYASLVREFAGDQWDPVSARMNSQSLDRALRCLDRLRQWEDPGDLALAVPESIDGLWRELLESVTEPDWAAARAGFDDSEMATE